MRFTAAVVILFGAFGTIRAAEPLRVVAYDDAGRELRHVSGVILDQAGYLVTARSVLPGARRLEVDLPGKGRVAVRWIAAEDPGAGLVKLWMGAVPGDVPLFRTEADAPPELVIDGKNVPVRKVRDVPGSGIVMELGATAAYEDAGGPVLDEQHRVAAVLIPQFLGTRNVAFCVPISHALELGPQELQTIEEWAETHDRAAEEAYQLALGEIWAEHYDSAARNLLEAVLAKPDFAEAWFHLGYAHAKLGHADEKLRYYRRAIAVRPNFAEAHFSLGFSLLLQGKRDEALQEVEVLRRILAPTLADKLSEMVESIHVDVLGKHDDVI